MNQTNNTIQFSQFAAVSKDSDEVLGKIREMAASIDSAKGGE